MLELNRLPNRPSCPCHIEYTHMIWNSREDHRLSYYKKTLRVIYKLPRRNSDQLLPCNNLGEKNMPLLSPSLHKLLVWVSRFKRHQIDSNIISRKP